MSWKSRVRRVLVKSHLEAPAVRLAHRIGLLTAEEHGHALLVERVLVALADGFPSAGSSVVEVGSTREQLPGQGSTAVLADLCASHRLQFVTVDMDPENTRRAAATVRRRSPAFLAVTDRGEAYLASSEEPLQFVYLDAFDTDHGRHSLDRQRRYEEHLGTSITNENCAQMHLECAEAIALRMQPGGVVVFDDTWRDEIEGWRGKGATAIPFLIACGFEVDGENSSAIAMRRT